MTPNEKAVSIYNSMRANTTKRNNAKRCAIIAVNELIYFANTELLSEIFNGDYYCDVDFFEEVKKEIEKL